MSRTSLWRLGPGALALGGLIAASSAQPPLRAARPTAQPGTAAPLMAFGSRSPSQWRSPTLGKLDGALADLARHSDRVRAAHALADLRSLSPAGRFAQPRSGSEPLVLIDAVTRGDPQHLEAALVHLGLEHPSLYINDVSGWLPVSQIGAAAARSEVHALRAAMPRTRAGVVSTQGDLAQGSAKIRTSWPTLDGTGVRVGILSDSYNCYAVYAQPNSGVPASGLNGYAPNGFLADAATDTSTGDVPATVTVLEEAGQISNDTCMDFGAPVFLPYGDEGRAMTQIVHDVAPGASVAFYSASEGEADFANGIIALANAGAKVIADDVGYADEPFFQDSLVSQAIDTVTARGIVYFSAAGNDSNLSYENSAPLFNIAAAAGAPNAGEMLLNFDTTGTTQSPNLPVTIPALAPGEFVLVVVEWDQPYFTGDDVADGAGASNRIDLCAIGAMGTDEILDLNTGQPVTCTGPNLVGHDPVQILAIGIPANAAGSSTQETVNFNIGVVSGAPPGRIKLLVADDGAGSTINAFATNSPTVQGHPGAAGAAAVGAAFFLRTPQCGTTPAVLDTYSSLGGDPILFDATGNRLSTPLIRQKPDFVGPDGVNTTFFAGSPQGAFGSGIAGCSNDTSYPSFFGTSAATPHVAAAAALMLQANPAVTPAQIRAALQASASAMVPSPPDFSTGYGFVQVDEALAQLPPASPTVSVTPSSITVGMSSTLSWTAVNVTACTASGSWSGSQLVSSSETLTPSAAGTLTYTLTCSNPHGSAKSSAMLRVQAAPSGGGSGGGGGGGLDVATLLALSALALGRLWSRRRRPA